MIAETRATFAGVETRVLSVPGNGNPVILFHGYADTADTWRGVLTRLEAMGRRSFAFDLPGFGQGGPRLPGPLLPQFDAFADAVLDHVGPAVLVGNSLGAATAVRAATRRHELVRGLVALDDPLNARHWMARLARSRDVSARTWEWLGRLPVPTPALRWAARHGLGRVLYGPGKVVDPAVMAYWAEAFGDPAALATLGRYALQYARETSHGHVDLDVTCPTVVVHGARDRIIPVQASRHLHRQIAGSRFVVLPHSGHCPQLDDPAAVVELIVTMGEVGEVHAAQGE